MSSIFVLSITGTLLILTNVAGIYILATFDIDDEDGCYILKISHSFVISASFILILVVIFKCKWDIRFLNCNCNNPKYIISNIFFTLYLILMFFGLLFLMISFIPGIFKKKDDLPCPFNAYAKYVITHYAFSLVCSVIMYKGSQSYVRSRLDFAFF